VEALAQDLILLVEMEALEVVLEPPLVQELEQQGRGFLVALQ
jgi:hypothetical protein